MYCQSYNEVSLHTGQNGHHQSLQIINAGEEVEKREPSYTVGKLVQPMWKNSMEVTQKTKNRIVI